MNKRIKNKLQKKLKSTVVDIVDAVEPNPIFCKVLASKEELEDVGCDLDLTGCMVEYIRDYPTGYSEIRIKHEEISEILEKPIYQKYDIPKYWLEFNL